MKKRIIMTLIVSVALLLILKQGSALTKGIVEDKIENINKTENIVFVGDSIFDWFPTEKIFSDLPIVNTGIAGNTTNDILNDMEKRIYQYNPTKVFINVGTNDIKLDDDSDELNETVANNIIKIAEEVKKHRRNSKVYIISIYPVNNNLRSAEGRHSSEIKAINSKLENYCNTSEEITFINTFDELKNNEEMFDTDYTNDGLHPNGLGYAKLTEILMKYIYE